MQLEKLSAELAALGGGAAQVARHRAIVYIGPEGSNGSILRYNLGDVCVRDPRAPPEANHSADRKFKVPACIIADQDQHGDQFNAEVSKVCSDGSFIATAVQSSCRCLVHGSVAVLQGTNICLQLAYPKLNNRIPT